MIPRYSRQKWLIYGHRARSLGYGMKLRPTHVMQWPKLG